jgi:von Willebrand factor type A domain/Calx-beta domain/RTX calcium-binding nonapeptide repeat (4 copies)
LTAGHNAFNFSNNTLFTNLRTTISANQPSLNPQRIIGLPGDPPANVINANVYFPKNYNTSNASTRIEKDISLFRTIDAPITAANTVGLLAFVNPDTAESLTITTAGYPVNQTNPIYDGTQLVLSPGIGTGTIVTTNSGGKFYYSDNVDTDAGQSGSGVWHILDGDTAPRVLGVHTNGYDPTILVTIQRNSGVLLTTDVYTKIVDRIQADSGVADAATLPENALVGSDSDLFSFLADSGNDIITGSYRRERILGKSGDDRLFGGGGDDRIEGGDGVDQALFSDIFTNYTYSITDPINKFFTFDHTKGTKADAKDSLKEIEFGVFEYVDSDRDGKDDDGNLFYVPLQVDAQSNTKLKDGPEIIPEKDILNSSGGKIGTITVKSPAWTFDGDVNYNLTLGAKQGTLFNFGYIIDTSGSMIGNPLTQAKNAYQTLTQSLIDKGIAANSEFAVIEFNSFASLTGPINAATAISKINSLSAGGGTEFGDALSKAQQFFQSRNNNATNIAYFLSDGVGNGASTSLQAFAEVRAFGIGGADLTSLNIIDSDDAVLLTNPADLVTQFNSSTLDKDTIDRIDVKLGGTVVATIAPNQLTVDALGRLSYEGVLRDLTVSRTAENQVAFEVIFKDGTPTTTLNYKITSGQEQVSTQSNSGTKEVITFSVNQADFLESASAKITDREVNANDLANTITVTTGNNILRGNGGNDRFILNGGTNLIDGGEGIDTVKINKTQATVGAITKNGNIVNIGTNTTLLNTEFIELDDVRLAVDTLAIIPIITLKERVISLIEGKSGSKTATFTVNLSSASTKDVTIDYTTRSSKATAGSDYTTSSGKLTIAAGLTSGTIDVEILGDTLAEGDERVFLDLVVSSGATFSDNSTKATAGINIQDDDSAIGISITADDPSVIEGDPDRPSKLILTLDRFGSLLNTDTIGYQLGSTGAKSAQADDFVNGFTPGQITFAPGERSKSLEISIAPDLNIEGDETFGLNLTSLAGTATVSDRELVLTIRDDDGIVVKPQFSLQKATEDIWTANGSGKVKVSLVAKNSDRLNEIGVFKLAADNTINGIAPGAAGFAKAALANSTTLFTALPDLTANGLDLSRVFQVDNNERLGFFLVNNGSIQDNLKENNFNNVVFSIDSANLNSKDYLKVTNNSGGFTLNWEQGNDESFQDLTASLEIDNSPNSALSSISNLQGKGEGEILDLRAFAGQTLEATFNVKREAAFNNIVGFYKIEDGEGTVKSLTGATLKPQDRGYGLAALANKIAGIDLVGENLQTVTTTRNIVGGAMYAPFLIIDGNVGDDNAFVLTSFAAGNYGQLDRVRLLGNNVFGFEDLLLGSDNDFNDFIVQTSFKTI